jgi:dihydrofolate reductase
MYILSPFVWRENDVFKILVRAVNPAINPALKVARVYYGTSNLENEGHKHAYIDGGTTIQEFINLELINEITITKAPILLGVGIPLFGKTFKDIKLKEAQAVAFPNDFIQLKYKVTYL